MPLNAMMIFLQIVMVALGAYDLAVGAVSFRSKARRPDYARIAGGIGAIAFGFAIGAHGCLVGVPRLVTMVIAAATLVTALAIRIREGPAPGR